MRFTTRVRRCCAVETLKLPKPLQVAVQLDLSSAVLAVQCLLLFPAAGTPATGTECATWAVGISGVQAPPPPSCCCLTKQAAFLATPPCCSTVWLR